MDICTICQNKNIYYICKDCLSPYCANCFGKRCDIGGGQDLDVYFHCDKLPIDSVKRCEGVCVAQFNYETGKY